MGDNNNYNSSRRNAYDDESRYLDYVPKTSYGAMSRTRPSQQKRSLNPSRVSPCPLGCTHDTKTNLHYRSATYPGAESPSSSRPQYTVQDIRGRGVPRNTRRRLRYEDLDDYNDDEYDSVRDLDESSESEYESRTSREHDKPVSSNRRRPVDSAAAQLQAKLEQARQHIMNAPRMSEEEVERRRESDAIGFAAAKRRQRLLDLREEYEAVMREEARSRAKETRNGQLRQ